MMFCENITPVCLRPAALAIIIMAVAVSCASSTQVAYLQDVSEGQNSVIALTPVKITAQPQDEISIIVSCPDPELTLLLNLPYSGQHIGNYTRSGSNFTQGVCGYFVDTEGCIDFPSVGKIEITGLGREQIAAKVKDTLKEKGLLQDAVVTVDFMNLSVSVLGEVNKPGRYFINRDELTLLDALSGAGDLTIFGIRDKVMVSRAENGVQKTYLVDLTSAQSLFSSPVYYLRQNDVVYVQPNSKKVGESTVNGNNTRSASFWISLSSLAASIATVIINAVR